MRAIRHVAALLVGVVLMFGFLGACTPKRRVVVVDAPAEVVATSRGFIPRDELCDGCGVRAFAAGWVFAVAAGKHLPVYFCAHHWHEVDDPGTAFEYYVDETDRVLTD